MPVPPNKISFPQFLFLSIGVPVILLVVLEVVCRLLGTSQWVTRVAPLPQALDMPTWMLREDNSRARAAIKPLDKDSLEWLSLFEEGPGFRLRMKPNAHARILNTFAILSDERQRRYEVRSNSLGFRGPELAPRRAPGTLRILLFGDSSSFGWGVNQDQIFSALLSSQLSERLGKHVEVGNFAIPGDSSEYGRLLFDHFAPLYDADLFIFGFGANDAKKVLTPHPEQVQSFQASESKRELRAIFEKSELVRTLSRAIEPPALSSNSALLKSRPLTVAVPLQRYRSNLAYMAHRAQELWHARSAILSICTPKNYALEAKKMARKRGHVFINGQRVLLDAIPQVRAGTLYPNLARDLEAAHGDELARESIYYVTADGCHPNTLASHILADHLTDLIAPILQKP